MSSVKDTPPKKYEISTHRFMQLYYHCLQYNEWKAELEAKCDTMRSINVYEAPISHRHADATQKLAMHRLELINKCELLERTAMEADATIGSYILKAVTNEDVTYNYLKMRCGIPCGKDMYYDRRKKFYWLLSQKLK